MDLSPAEFDATTSEEFDINAALVKSIGLTPN